MFCRKCGSETFEHSHCPDCGAEVNNVLSECPALDARPVHVDALKPAVVAPAAALGARPERVGTAGKLLAALAVAFMLCVLAACVSSVVCRIGEKLSPNGVRPTPAASAEGFFEI